MNSRTCRSCGAAMAAEDAFCPECGMHAADQALIPADEVIQPGGQPPRRPRASSSVPATASAYDKPYERIDGLEPARPVETHEMPVGDDGVPDPIRSFDSNLENETDEDDEYAGYPESSGQKFSPIMLGLAAVFIAIIIAGIIVAFAGGSDDGGGSTSTGVGGGQLAGKPVSAGGFGSMLPDGSFACTKGTVTGPGPRTAVAGAVEILAAPATWSSRDVVKGRFVGTGAGRELTLNPADHDRAAPQSARISVLTVETDASYFPDQFLMTTLQGKATTVKQDCVDYGQYTALRVHRVELASGGTLSTRYVVLYDKVRRGSAVLFVFEDPRSSTADADFFESMVASSKLLK